jgi:nicotinate-nucleotide pyrophosphorylase (carboxylating)
LIASRTCGYTGSAALRPTTCSVYGRDFGLDSRRITAILENALLEDRATRDATSYACIDVNQRASATILAKQDCVLSGLGCVHRILDVFAVLDGTVTSHPEVTSHTEIFDGVRVRKGQSIAVVVHNARVILSCERVILNIMQRMSGIATLTRRYVDAVEGTGTVILDTRKTAPGLRVLDKYAVTCGGGHNHRLDLSDGVLIKNNHIALAGGVLPALDRALRNRRGSETVEIEVRSLEELEAGAGPRRRSRPARQHDARASPPGSGTCPHTKTAGAPGSLRRNHAGERPRLRRNRRQLHLGWRADPLRSRRRSQHAPRAGVRK